MMWRNHRHVYRDDCHIGMDAMFFFRVNVGVVKSAVHTGCKLV